MTPPEETAALERVLARCPFCGEPLFIRRGVNPYGRCETDGCWMRDEESAILSGKRDAEYVTQAFARHRQQARDAGFAEGSAWHPIDSAPMWQVAIVTDGENVALAQKAETDFDGFYWAVDPEDALEWEPTHWIAPPALSAEANEGRCDE